MQLKRLRRLQLTLAKSEMLHGCHRQYGLHLPVRLMTVVQGLLI